ncbi:hypothetical protein T03_14871, partial [Trichinella britovi]
LYLPITHGVSEKRLRGLILDELRRNTPRSYAVGCVALFMCMCAWVDGFQRRRQVLLCCWLIYSCLRLVEKRS